MYQSRSPTFALNLTIALMLPFYIAVTLWCLGNNFQFSPSRAKGIDASRIEIDVHQINNAITRGKPSDSRKSFGRHSKRKSQTKREENEAHTEGTPRTNPG